MDNEWKLWSWVIDDIDRVIFNGPGWIKKVIVSAKSTKKINLQLHDGIDTSGPLKLRLHTVTGDTKDVDFPVPLRFEKGLYVNQDDDTEKYHIQYREEK